jgi:hypothetical protein
LTTAWPTAVATISAILSDRVVGDVGDVAAAWLSLVFRSVSRTSRWTSLSGRSSFSCSLLRATLDRRRVGGPSLGGGAIGGGGGGVVAAVDDGAGAGTGADVPRMESR